MIGETVNKIINRYAIEDTLTHILINTDVSWYNVTNFGFLESNYVPFATDEEYGEQFYGQSIVKIASDGVYTIIELSGKDFLHVNVGGYFDIGIYHSSEYNNIIDWMENRMFALNKECSVVPNDWQIPE